MNIKVNIASMSVKINYTDGGQNDEFFSKCMFGGHASRNMGHNQRKPEDQWSCIAHLSAEHMLKSAVIEEKKFKYSPWAGADNPLGPKF